MRVDAASQVGAQLAFDVARHTAIMNDPGLGQKRLEVSRNQPVKRSRLRPALLVVQCRGMRGGPHTRALANGVPAMNLGRSGFVATGQSLAVGGQASGAAQRRAQRVPDGHTIEFLG
jgi:hypothetical protein